MIQIREEFEKAFNSEGFDNFDSALWAAKWMAERCANHILLSDLTKMALASEIRKIANEL